MKSQEPGRLSTQREANRQALTCIAIVSLASCVLIIVLGLVVWSLGPQMYALIATQVAELSETTAAVLYVRSDGTGWTCGSWENACGLQTALAAATAGDEIWVKAGIYRPATDTRFLDATFQLKEGVALYGGFAGMETTRDQRDWETQITVLSGDLGGDDITDPNGVVTDTANIVGQNAYHVITGSGVDTTAVLDGFVITAGYASLTPPKNGGFGGGMFNWTGSPTLNNLIFSGNTAGKGAPYYGGGGMFNIYSSNPILTNVTFVANTAGSGSGMYNYESSPTLTDVVFSNNVSGHVGGAMMNEDHSNPILTNVLFSSNSAYHEGGGMFNTGASNPVLTNVAFMNNAVTGGRGGGGGIKTYNSSPILTNVTFSGNHALVGGGIDNWQSSLTLTNVTFSGNTADQDGAAMFSQESTPTIVNTIIWGNRPADSQLLDIRGVSTVTYSIIAGGHPGTGNLNLNPQFGPLAEDDGFTPAYSLPPGSPAIDAGSPSGCPATDQLGLPRPVDGDGNGSAICDMGAFEYQTPD